VLVPGYFIQSGEQYPLSQPTFLVPMDMRAPSPWSALLGVGLVLGGLWTAAGLFSPKRLHDVAAAISPIRSPPRTRNTSPFVMDGGVLTVEGESIAGRVT
jgi:hypothetical protein